MIKNGTLDTFVDWYDTQGNVINASDGGMIFVEGKYYWYGMALRPLPVKRNGLGGQTTTTGVVMYSSADLTNWDYEGVVLPCATNPKSPLYPPMRFERPKIVYNQKTKKFVLWCHYVQTPGDHGTTPGTGEAGVAVSDSITGPFQWLGTTRPIDDDGIVRDCTVYQDDDQTAYFIYDRDVKDNRCLYVVKLAPDYLTLTDEYVRIESAYRREAAAVVKKEGYYYILTSALTGWKTNQAQYYRTKNLMDQWEVVGDPCLDDFNHTTFESQSTLIFPVENSDLFIHMAERHNTENFLHCSYI